MSSQLTLDGGRKRRGPVLVALAGADDELVAVEIQVLHPESSALEQAQARAVHQDGHEAGSAAEPLDHSAHLVAREHDRQPNRPPGPHHVVEPGHLLLEDLAIQEQQRAQCLILGRCGDVALDGEPAQIPGELGATHLGGMPLLVEEDVAPNPRDVGLLGSPAIVAGAHGIPDPVEQAPRAGRGWRWFPYNGRGAHHGIRRWLSRNTHRLDQHSAAGIPGQGCTCPDTPDHTPRYARRTWSSSSRSRARPCSTMVPVSST